MAGNTEPAADGVATAGETACPACGGARLSPQYRPAPGFMTARCGDCRFVFLSPYPSDAFLRDHYRARELYGHYSTVRADYDRAVADRAALIRTALGSPTFAGRAVDFGAGAGIAVAALASLGFEASGIEANPKAAQAARDLFGVDIADIELDDLEPGLAVFTLFEVLEHIRYPARFLEAVRDKLAPGGCLVGSVPNYDSLARYALGTRSVALAFPEHISQFTRRSLRATLEQAGFTVAYIGCPPPYGFVVTLDLRRKILARFGRNPFSLGLSTALTWIKKYLVYPLPNLIVRRTGWLATGLVFMARKS